LAAASALDSSTVMRHSLRALINAGADLRLTDRAGRNALQLARQRGFKEMLKILEAARR
jgi:hypothetical protein